MSSKTKLLFASLLVTLTVGSNLPAQSVAEIRREDAAIQARNAARVDKGGRILLETLAPNVVKDRNTHPETVIDGNVHSRQVMTGAPYRFRIDLIDELPIDTINLICSDYSAEVSPKDVEIKLSDGTVYRKTMERLIPQRNQAKPRQAVDVGGKKASWVEVTILNNHSEGARVNWGGIGEIEVLTSADLAGYLELVAFNPDLPQDIRSDPPRADYSDIEVTMPEEVPLGERPGIFKTAAGWKGLFDTMRASERGRPTVNNLVGMANGYFNNPIEFPDPNEPAQVKARGDAPAKAHDNLAKQAGIMGYAWMITGDIKYAERARDILVGYAKLYPDEYKEHKGVNAQDTGKVMAQRLSEAMWLIPLIQTYDFVADSPAFNDEQRALVEKDLITAAMVFINGKSAVERTIERNTQQNPDWRTAPARKTGGTLGNWTAFYNMAYIHGGSVLKNQDWIDIGAAGLKHMLENGIGDDGMWGEGSISYQQFARHAIVGGLEALAVKGIDLWSYKGNVFKSLFDSEFAYAYPDGTSPGINDSGRSPVGSGWTAMAFDYAWLRYGDQNYAHTINKANRQLHHSPSCYFPTQVYEPLEEVPVKGHGSIVFDKLGYAILRGHDGGNPTFMLMDYGPHGGVHGHPDKLNLILFADGDELAGEPRPFAYEDARHRNWTTASVAHWTLSIDERSQNPTTGRLVCFADEGDIKVMRGQSNEAYIGVGLDRTVVQLPGYIVDIHRAWGPGTHTVDYPLSFRGQLDLLDGVADADLKPMAELTPGYMHLEATPLQDVAGSWTGTWTRENNRVVATVLPAPGTQACVAKVPGNRHQALIRRVGRDVSFIGLITPYLKGDTIKSAREVAVDGPHKVTRVEIERLDGGMDEVTVSYDPLLEGEPTAPLVSVIRKDAAGKQISALQLGGSAAR